MNSKHLKPKQRMVAVCAVFTVGLLILWGFKVYETNQKSHSDQIEIYEMGETVEIGDNFFVDAKESLNGYSVTVNSAQRVGYQEYIEANGGTVDETAFSETYPMPTYMFLVNITLKNVANTEGDIMVLKYGLCDKSLYLPVDFVVWGLIDERFDGYPFLKLLENSQTKITLPFVPMPLNVGINATKVDRMMEQDDFYFCICEFPVRKMIRVSF